MQLALYRNIGGVVSFEARLLGKLSLQPANLLLPSASRLARRSITFQARAVCILSNALQLTPCIRAAMYLGSRPLPLSAKSGSIGSSSRTLLSLSEQSRTLCLHSERLPTHIGAAPAASTSAPSTAAPQQPRKKLSSRNAGKQTDWLAGEAHRKSRHSRTQPSKSRGPGKPQDRQLHTETAADTRQFYDASERPPKRSSAQSMAAFQQKQQHTAAQQRGDPQPAAAAPGATAAGAQATADTGPTHVQRKSGVTDGPWDRHDTHAVSEALQDGLREATQQGSISVLLGQSRQDLEQFVVSLRLPGFRGKQLYDGIMHGARSIHDINNIPKAMKEELAARGIKTGRSLLQQTVAAKDGTRKFLLQLADGRVVEAVGIPNDKDSRLTACVSSQVGCPMRCTFCATGKGGFARNLKPHEIIDQVLTIQEEMGTRVSNVVFMGMGEPLLNMRSVLAANRFITSDIGVGARHITISSVGVPNAIMKLASHMLQNTLAISIHAPTQELRERLVPSARVYPLEALLLDCHKYFQVTGRRITFEYTLMAGVNDSVVQAKKLAALLKRFDLRAHVNVIPWNPVDESEFKRPTNAAVAAFTAALDEAGVTNTTRITRGLEAAAACGQLQNQFQKEQMQDYAALT